MTDKLDQMIEAALAEEDRAIIDETQELGLFAQMAGQFRGRNAWVNWLTTVAMLAYAGFALWAAVEFFTATDPAALIFWGVIGTVSIFAIGMLKLYMLDQMQADRVIRQLKRIELMLARRDG